VSHDTVLKRSVSSYFESDRNDWKSLNTRFESTVEKWRGEMFRKWTSWLLEERPVPINKENRSYYCRAYVATI
jgi:hypothetical protein